MELGVPTISVIIGEGGSGGAVALSSSNKVVMFSNAIYSVISPEGCATILWRDPTKTLEAARAMRLSAKDLLNLGVIDEIIKEPDGGAHRDRDLILENTKNSIKKNLNDLKKLNQDELINHRKNKFLSIGRSDGFIKQSSEETSLSMKTNLLDDVKKFVFRFKNKLAIFGLFVLFFILYSVL